MLVFVFLGETKPEQKLHLLIDRLARFVSMLLQYLVSYHFFNLSVLVKHGPCR